MKTTKINTYLPIFQGFYGTFFEADNEDDEINDINSQREAKGLAPIDYDKCNWDYSEYHEDVSKQCVDAIERKLQEILNKDVKISFQALASPKEYNFTNDSINIEIKLNKEAQNTIVKILKDNERALKPYIEERYSSRDGFISSHSAYYEEWIEAIKTWDNDLLAHKLGAILGFILETVEGYGPIDLYDDIETHLVYASNYNELIEG